MTSSTQKNIVIVGGGFSGIGCALRLLKQGHTVTIIESGERLGGLAYAFVKNGKFIHTGYHQILSSDKPLLALFKDLKQDHRIRWKKPGNKVLLDGNILDLVKPLDFIRVPLSLMSKIRFAVFIARCYAKRRWHDLEGVSAEDWIVRWAGREVLDVLFAPLFDIKFGMKPSEVSAAWVGSRLASRENTCLFGYIPGKEWTTELCAAAHKEIVRRGGTIILNQRVRRIEVADATVVGVTTDSGMIPADVVVSTVSPIILKSMIDLKDPNLDSITYIDSLSSIVSVKQTRQDFYWLVCLRPRKFMGGLFNLTDLNPTLGVGKERILNFFTNVDHGSPLLSMSDKDLIARYKKEYQEIYGETLQINWYKINRIPFVSAKYVKGYKNPSHRTKIRGLYLCGNYMSYPSVTSTGTALQTGIDASRVILEDL